MKNLKLICLLICIAYTPTSWGQLYWDIQMNAHLFAILTEVTAIEVQRVKLKDDLSRLSNLEKEYQDKIALKNNDLTATAAAAIFFYEDANKLAGNLTTKIAALKSRPPFRYPLLKNIESELEIEKTYLAKINPWDLDAFVGAPKASGGAGYGKNSFAKLILNVKKINTKLFELQYRLDNLEVFTAIILLNNFNLP